MVGRSQIFARSESVHDSILTRDKDIGKGRCRDGDRKVHRCVAYGHSTASGLLYLYTFELEYA
jgi:hypothetical protein